MGNIITRATLTVTTSILFLNFRWSSKVPLNTNSRSDMSPNNKKQVPIITVEGRGRGIAVVQMKSTFYTTSNDILQGHTHRKRHGDNVVSSVSLEAFNLEPKIEIRGGHNGTPATQLFVVSCQKYDIQAFHSFNNDITNNYPILMFTIYL